MPARPMPLHYLIGAPLRSLVLGQGIASRATSEYLGAMGFAAEPGQATARARTFEFTYDHPTPDPERPGETIPTPTRVTVPWLSMLPTVPAVSIAEATIEFRANVLDLRDAVMDADQKAALEAARLAGINPDASFLSALRGGPDIVAAYAPASPTPRGETAVSFTIRVEREPASEGLLSVLNLLNDAITAQPVRSTDIRTEKTP